MSFATQTLVWAILVGIALVVTMRARWRDIAIGPWRVLPLVVTAGVTAAWASTLEFFGRIHVAYLIVTVAPACVVAAAVALPDGRAWLRTRGGALLSMALLVPPAVGLYASHVEPFWLVTDELEVVVDAGSGIRIGVLADLQTPQVGAYERDAVAELLAADPDVILIPGDLWQMSDEQIVDDWPIFSDLVGEMVAAVGHVVIVEGDTDHVSWLDRIGERTGALIAHNRVVEVQVGTTRVLVGGTQLLSSEPPRATLEALGELAAAESDDVVTIALSHRPDVVFWLPGPVDLVVAGHTHGGQIQVPFFGPLVTFSDVPRHVAAGGLHEVDEQAIYVSTGVGRERKQAPQIRFNARPSIGVLDLVEG